MAAAFFGATVAAFSLAILRGRKLKARRTACSILEDELRNGHAKLWAMLSCRIGKQLNIKLVCNYLKKRGLNDPSRGHVCTYLTHMDMENLLLFARGHVLATLEVKPSNIPEAGNGLFATRNITNGSFLCVYRGTKLSLAKVMSLPMSARDYIMGGFGLNAHVDASQHTDVLARYLNDNFDTSKINTRFIKLESDACAMVFSTRDILKGEELYVSYGESYWRARKGYHRNRADK